MTTREACADIEQELRFIPEKRFLRILKKFIPEESIDYIENDEFREEMISIILERIEDDCSTLEDFYENLLNEKITIEEEQNYEEFE